MRDRFSKSLVGLVLSVILTMAFGINSRAQTDDLPPGKPASRVFVGRDGLPQASAMSLTTDRQGYVWLATQDGAARFNGREWTLFNMPDRTVSNFVRATLGASDGSVWFGRQDGGAAQLRPDGTWVSFTVRNGLPGSRVNCLLECRTAGGASSIWLGTNTGGVAVFEDGKWTVHDIAHGELPHNRVLCLAQTTESGKPVTWIGTPGGLVRYDGARWERVTLPSDYQSVRVGTMCHGSEADGSPVLWVGGTNGEVARLVRGRWQTLRFQSTNFITTMIETRANDGTRTLWVGTDGDGVYRLTNGVWSRFDSASGLPNPTVWSLLKSDAPNGATSVLWIGTDGGLMSIRFGRWTGFDGASGLRGNSIYGMYRSETGDGNARMWFGTRGAGLVKYEAGNWSAVTKADGLPSNSIFSVFESRGADGRATLWAGTQEGLCRNDGAGWRPVNDLPGLAQANVRVILETAGLNGKRGLWFVTSGLGLVRFEDGKWTKLDTGAGLPTNLLHCVCETRGKDGRPVLWVGTETGGLARLEDGKWRVFNMQSGLPNNTVMTLREVDYPDGKRVLWAGTEGSGVCLIDLDAPDVTFRVLSDESTPALPNNTVYQAQVDAKKRVYLFTNKGVARLTRRAGPALEFDIERFTAEDGLPSDEFNGGASFIDARGRIWGGTPAGAAMFDPASEISDSASKPLFIERAVRIGEGGRAVPSGASLSYRECNLAFDFALLNYAGDSRIRYRSQLVGFESEPTAWSGDFKRSFTNLPAGDYVFKVWAVDDLGIESGPVEWRFTVRPAPWLTWWAYVLYGVLGFGLIYGGVQVRLQTLRKRTVELETKVGERTTELAQAVRELKAAQVETERKNEQLVLAKSQVELKNQELDRKVEELVVAQKRADRIFSALAEALPGTVLDEKYRLDEKIGAGGFGAVFKATHLALNRHVAVKVFRPAPGNDTSEAVERFRLEGISASRVNHPNAVTILDSGVSTEGIAYLVMELLQGQTLARELKLKGHLSLARCAAIVGPLCDVLDTAHAQGIVHRDIKPDNVFLHQSPEGEVLKVVDFGIAKMLGENSVGNSDDLTLTGSFVGTPVYMAPERFNRQPFDGRADVYSVAVMIFEMLCGRTPFVLGPAGPFALVMDHLQTPAPLMRAFQPDLPQEIEEVVQRGLAKEPEERPTAATFASGFLIAAGKYVALDLPVTGANPADSLPTASGLATPAFGRLSVDTDPEFFSNPTTEGGVGSFSEFNGSDDLPDTTQS